jgi:hypothetical protein
VTAKISIVFLFALISLLPAVQHLTKIVPDQPLNENRSLAPQPDWARSTLKDYLLGWQTWFNDRYAGRNFLIRLKTQLDYSVFGVSDRIHIGREGWLFYRSVIDVQEPQLERLTDAHHDQIVANLRELNRRLAEKGVRLFILDNELKDVFYPEYLPTTIPRRRQPTRYSQLRQRIAMETGAEFVDSHAVLWALKSERPVFHRTDFHWNDPAAFAVARAVVERMAVLNPGHSGWRWPLVIQEKEFSGGEAAFMPLLRAVTETGLFVEKTWVDLPRVYRQNDGPFEYSIIHTAEDPTLLPGLVVFGDSFFDGMVRSGFIEHFRSVHRARTYQATLDQTLHALPDGTRLFLLQFIETAVPYFSIPLGQSANPTATGSAGTTH